MRSVSAVSTSSAENGSSISSMFGMHDQRAREADALAHAARQLARIGGLEAVEADQVDRRERALADLRARHALAPRARAARSRSTVSQGNSAKLWNTMAMPARRAVDRLAADSCTSPALGADEPGDEPQQRRLARARAAEQAHDLALASAG